MKAIRVFLRTTFLFFLCSTPSWAQAPSLVLRGRVLDAGTRQPIPGAHLRVGKLGTAANADGRFELRLPESARSQRMVVSCIGYQNQERAVAASLGRELTLHLAEAPHQLAETTVYSSARAIVKEAVARIPQNYPTRPVRLTAFYREANRMSPGDQYTYLAEGLMEIHKPPYDRPGQNDQTRVVQYRKRELMPFDSTQLRWVQGATFGEWADFVRNRTEFIREPDRYAYTLRDITRYDGRDVYAIEFRPAVDRGQYQGTLYVTLNGLAMVAAEWRVTPGSLQRRSQSGTVYRQAARKAEYQFFNGRWYLQQAFNETVIEQTDRRREHRVSDELVVTDFDTTAAEGFRYPEVVQSTDAFVSLETPYDSTFWQRYNVTLQSDELARQLRERDIQEQARRVFSRPDSATKVVPAPPKRRPWLRGVSRDWLLSTVGAEALTSSARLGYQAPGSSFGFDRQVPLATRPLVLLGWGTRFRIGAGGFAGWSIAVTPFAAQGGYRAYQSVFRTGWSWNLNPKRRPIRLETSVGYGRTRLAHDLGRFDNPDSDLRLGGRRFNAPTITAQVRQSVRQVMPTLGISVEASRRREFFADVTYFLPLADRAYLRLREGQGFFPRNARLPLPNDAVTVPTEQPGGAAPFALQHWQVRLGVRINRFW